MLDMLEICPLCNGFACECLKHVNEYFDDLRHDPFFNLPFEDED